MLTLTSSHTDRKNSKKPFNHFSLHDSFGEQLIVLLDWSFEKLMFLETKS